MRQVKTRIVAAIQVLVEAWIQKRCLLTGHSGVRETGQGEVFERCTTCGRRSPGWQLPATRPKRRPEPTAAERARARYARVAAAVPAAQDEPTSSLADDAGFEPVPAFLQPTRRPYLFVAESCFGVSPADERDQRLLRMRTKGVH